MRNNRQYVIHLDQPSLDVPLQPESKKKHYTKIGDWSGQFCAHVHCTWGLVTVCIKDETCKLYKGLNLLKTVKW